MSPEETQLLKSLFDRVRSASSTPRDAEAETLITQAVRDQPASPYYLAQAVIVQEKGLEAAAAHIRQLEERIHQLESGNTAPQQAQQGGFLSSIFGGSQQQAPAPAPAPTFRNDTSGQTQGPWGRSNDAPQPTGPWSGQQPSAFGRTGGGGGGFLQGALGAAAGVAGVAGGMLLANSLSGIFSNHVASTGWGSGLGGAGSGAAPVEETVINNYYGDDEKPQQDADNGGNDVQQASYDDSNDDDTDFDSGDGDSFV
ncbi:DUF2076 family protein [Rhizobium sp. Leaf262]|uniref:DUF2076 domain-containing protein n=1 Tax=Rhizobium sp. Leaf262 TaxID=1736312 RepID=UPI0007129D05|nr:DUF2076 family protein [Rhizobium sp. Leaf262]KQO82160.1 ABC transporter substrate-binding protein [Rhizobium sp. Leaf262]